MNSELVNFIKRFYVDDMYFSHQTLFEPKGKFRFVRNNLEKFEELEEFILVESNKITAKINYLNKEKFRLSELLDKFKRADQNLRKDYPMSERADINYIKNPRPYIGSKIRPFDGENGADVDYLKNFVLDQIKFKRENNEYKIKKIRDRIEQVNNEILDLRIGVSEFQNILERVKGRFSLEDYPSVKQVADLDPKDVDPSIPVTRKDAGREVIEGKTYYLALSIKSFNRTITFDTAAPTVKPNQIINIINGRNNGTKTVYKILSSTTIQVYEDLLDESPATSKISID
jgi:hypothetical protein